MAKYLATFSDILNDIEIKGFVIMTDKEMERYEELAASINWDFSYHVGEEKIQFESGEDLLTRVDFKEISNEEYKCLKKVFENEFGTFVTEEYLDSILDEDDIDGELDNEEDYEDRDFNDRRKGHKYDDEFDD
jgi:hypothetical protein